MLGSWIKDWRTIIGDPVLGVDAQTTVRTSCGFFRLERGRLVLIGAPGWRSGKLGWGENAMLWQKNCGGMVAL